MKRIIAFVLALTLASGIFMLAPPANALSFPDVKPGNWYYDNVMLLTEFGVINGKDDGKFWPDGTVKRGEFIKMLAIAAEYLYTTTPSKGIHWSEQYWNMLNDALVLEVVESKPITGSDYGQQYTYPLIPLSFSELEKPISRYEMAYIINRVLYMVYYENQMQLKDSNDSFANHIADYNTMDKGFQGSVEQVYSKGILTGYTDTTFQGSNNLTRAEAASVITRLLWSKQREAQTFAVEKPREEPDPSFVSFAFQYRSMSEAERRTALFGNPNKTYFASAAEAQPYMVSIQIPIWKLNESTGQKYSTTVSITVHKLVEKEVKAIFNEIFNSPEKFPINSIGGSRYSDTMRHSWGCAIDINPNENYYINYKTGQTVGSFCYKNGSSPYCITPESSVVKAFARYGWGWGGQGWSTAADYMHFSILSSGG